MLKHRYSLPEILLLVFAFVIPFQRLFHSSWFIYKFQLPEFIAIPLCIVTLLVYNHRVKPHPIVYPIILFVIWAILSAGLHFSKAAVLEGLGIAYLFLIGYATYKIVRHARSAFPVLLLQVFVVSIVLNCILSLFGLFLFYRGIENDLGIWYAHYPITGSLFRMKGFTSHPIMLSNLAICAFFLCLSLFHRYRNIILMMLVIGIAMAMTKSILSGIAAFVFIYFMHTYHSGRRLSISISLICISILLLKEYPTHFTFPLSDPQVTILSQAQYWGGDIKIPVNATHSIYSTLYTQLKIASWEAFLENPITGIGGGNTNVYNLEKANRGLLPSSIRHYDPHSTILGVLSEFGIIGFTLLFFSCKSVIKSIQQMLDVKKSLLLLGLLTIIVFITFESLSADVLNYRHLWLFGGIVFGLYFSTISPTTKPGIEDLNNGVVPMQT